MSRRRKNPHPQRAVNARTVLKIEKEEPLVLRSRMIPDAEDEEANRQRRKVKKGEKNSKSAERSVARGERENRVKTMIPPNTNQKPDEPVPPKPALDATTTISPPALVQQKVSPKGGGMNQNDQLPPVPPLPEHLKNADTETKLLYFREAKRVLIEKCRENRCGNDEVTRETHGLGEFTSGWKRPGLRECTAQEFAYDFFKFHEQRGEFDYENVWEYVLVRSRLMFFMIICGGRHREMRSFFFARASSRCR